MKLTCATATAALVLLGAALNPALAAPKETLEATATRVTELEKANVVLQEDLARTRLQLDVTRSALDKARADLNAETAARKALEEKLAAAQQQSTRDIASTNDQLKAALDKAIADLAARHDAELAALRQGYDQKIAGLQKSLTDETAARQAQDEKATQEMVRLEKRQRQDRTWGFAMNGLNLGITLFK